MADDEISVQPDSVLVYGEPIRLETIEAVYTKPIRYYDICEDLQGVIVLEKIKGVRVSENEASYSVGVKRYVEVSSMVSVKPVNVPADKVMKVYPSVVEVSLRCNFPMADEPLSTLRVEAVDNDYINSLGGNCTLKAKGLSRSVISYEIEPVAVSCVIEEK